MAKKKRLNKKLVIILASVGMVILAGGIGFWIWRQPEDPKVYASRAAAFLKEGKYKSAAFNYHIAADVSKGDNPKKAEYYLSWAEVLLEWRQKDKALGQSAKDKNLGEALGALRKAMIFDPEFIEAQRILTRWEYRIYSNPRAPDYKECIATTNELLKLVPDDHEAIHQRAAAYMQLAKAGGLTPLKLATEDFLKLVEIAPDQENYWLGLVAVRSMSREADRLEQVEKTYEEALAANRESVAIRINYARFLLGRKRKPEALKLLIETVEVCPDEATGYLALAAFYRRERDLDRVVENLQKAIEVEPADYRGYVELSQIYVARKELDEAETVLKKGLDAIRENKKDDLEDGELRRYHVSVVTLDHLICDILLDGLETSPNREKTLQSVRGMLKEMQGISADDSDLAWFHDSRIDKIEGRLALVDGNLVKAEKFLRKAYDSFRTINRQVYVDPKTVILLVNLYPRLGQPGEAQNILVRFGKIKGESLSALMARLNLHISSRQYEQAQILLRSMLKQERTEALVSIQAGLNAVMERGGGRIPPELKSLDSLAVRLFYRRARQLWLQGEQAAAIQMLSDVLSRQPKNFSMMVQMIRWHKTRKEIARANEIAAYARQIFKDDPAKQKRLSLLMETDPKKVQEQLLAQASEEPDPVRKALRIAEIYRAYGQEEKSLEHLAVAESKDPENPTVIRQRFMHAINKSDWEKARKYADVAAKINLDNAGGATFRAELAFKRKQWDEAIGFLQEALRVRPRFSRAHSLMGDCYRAKNEVEQAKKQYEAAYSQNPANTSALIGMIYVSAAAGNTADYTRWVKQAYKFAPQNTQVREAYLRLQGDPEEVIKYRKEISKTQPKNLVNLYRLATLYEQTGRIFDAEQAFRAIIGISGGDPVAVGALAEFLNRRNRDVEARNMLAGYVADATDKVAAYLAWADYIEKTGESEQAETICKKAIAADPNDPRGYHGTARHYARNKQWIQASENQQKYIKIKGEKTPLQEREVLLAYLINADKLDDAEKKIDQELQKDRTNVEMLTLKASIYIKRKDYTKAKEILDNTLKIRSDYVPAMMGRAEVHLARGDADLAMADLEAAKLAGATPKVTVRLAGLYESMNRVDDAIGLLQGLLSDYPQDNVILKLLVRLYGRQRNWSALEEILAVGKKAYPNDAFWLRHEAEMWLRRKVPARAVAAFDEAAKLAPDDATIAFLRMSALTEAERFDDAIAVGKKLRGNENIASSVMAVMAWAMAKSNRHSAADAEFASALKLAKSDGQILFVLKQVQKAYPPAQIVEKLKLLLKVKPDDLQIYLVMSGILARQGKDLELAVGYLNKALTGAKTDREKTAIMGRLGLIYFTLGRHDDSLRMYKDTLKINPDNARVLNNLAWLLAHDMNKLDQALPYAEKACKLIPDSSEFLDTYGYILMRQGKYDEALVALSRSVDKRVMPANRLHLGEVYEKMNRKDDAYRQYQSGWELVKDDPNNKYYREFSEAIKRLGGTPGGSAE